jgi:hypothetical protein
VSSSDLSATASESTPCPSGASRPWRRSRPPPATRRGFLGQEKDLGTVERGKVADLVLLDADPLAYIHNTTKIAAVMVNAKLLPRNELDKMLAEVEAANKEK